MQVHIETSDRGLEVHFELDEDEDSDEQEAVESEENTGEGAMDSTVNIQLTELLTEKMRIERSMERVRKYLYALVCVLLPSNWVVPLHTVTACEFAELGLAYAIRKRSESDANNFKRNLENILSRLPSGEKDRMRWRLRCAGLIDESS